LQKKLTMSDGDVKYMEEQGIQNALSLALAQVIREQPPNALKRIAQIISPDTFIDPEAVAALRAADAVAAQPSAPEPA
jgi:hypothetical protein